MLPFSLRWCELWERTLLWAENRRIKCVLSSWVLARSCCKGFFLFNSSNPLAKIPSIQFPSFRCLQTVSHVVRLSKWKLILASLCCGKYYKRKHHPTLWPATLAPSVSLPPWLAPGLLCSHGWSLPHQPHAAIHPLWLWSQFPVTWQNQNSRGL